MAVRSIGALALAILLGGCGGTGTPGATLAPGATSTPVTATATPAGPPVGGEVLDTDGLIASFNALQALDSWTFAVTYWWSSISEPFERKVSGTERRKPQTAVDATHPQPDGTSLRYIRIGDDIWANLGTETFYHYAAAGSENLIDQYEPFYLAALVHTAGEWTGFEYNRVGDETVNGVAVVHYRLSAENRATMAQFTTLTPDQWAGDVWIAHEGGYLVRFAWGPQSIENAQALMGVLYDVTVVNCTCPISAPTNVASP